ncbi:hypothetical protein Dimus_030034, partial [Dionaea muscipula]
QELPELRERQRSAVLDEAPTRVKASRRFPCAREASIAFENRVIAVVLGSSPWRQCEDGVDWPRLHLGVGALAARWSTDDGERCAGDFWALFGLPLPLPVTLLLEENALAASGEWRGLCQI